MMKGKKIIISGLIIIMVITIIGFIGCKHHKSTTPVADLIQSHLDQVGEAQLPIEIKLIDFTSFEWDEVLIFNYPTTEIEIEDALGVSYNGETDLVSGMIFVKNGEITHMEYFDYDYNFDRPGKFLICPQTKIETSPHYRVFSAKDAVFSGEKAESDGYAYYRLYPTSSKDSSRHKTDTTQLSSWEGCYEYYEFFEPNINMQYHIDIYQNDSSYYADVEILGFQTDKKLLCTVVGDENRINIIYAETVKPEMYNTFKPGDILLAFQQNDTGLETEWIGLTPLQRNANANDYFKQVSDKTKDGCSNSEPVTITEQTYTFTDNNCNIQISYPKIDQEEYGGLKAFSSEERSSFLESILSGKDSYAMRQVYIENEKLYFIVGSLSHALGDYSIICLNTKK